MGEFKNETMQDKATGTKAPVAIHIWRIFDTL